MRTTIDLTQDASYPGGDGLPSSMILLDDGDTVIILGEVEIRTTCAQFDRLLTAANAWMAELPATDEHDVLADVLTPEERRQVEEIRARWTNFRPGDGHQALTHIGVLLAIIDRLAPKPSGSGA